MPATLLHELALISAARAPERSALTFGTDSLSYGELAQRIEKGDLDFAEMPISADFSALLAGRMGRRMHAAWTSGATRLVPAFGR